MTTYTLTRTEYLEDDVEAEHLTCMPIAELGRDLRRGDHVHARCTKNGNDVTLVGRLHESEEGMVLKVRDLDDVPVTDIEIVGLLVGRQQVFRV